MKITVSEDEPGKYTVALDDAVFILDGRDIKELLLQITGIMAPSSGAAKQAEAHRKVFMARLRAAEDVGMQAFIQTADHDDMVVLLKIAESDEVLSQKLFNNMSDTSRKIFLEDLEFKFRDEISDGVIRAAVDRLERVVQDLEADGRQVYPL